MPASPIGVNPSVERNEGSRLFVVRCLKPSMTSARTAMIEHGRKTRQVIEKIGGASRDRTDGLVVANDALSQLSYSPTQVGLLLSELILSAFSGMHQDQSGFPIRFLIFKGGYLG